jgi:hypothetical protein
MDDRFDIGNRFSEPHDPDRFPMVQDVSRIDNQLRAAGESGVVEWLHLYHLFASSHGAIQGSMRTDNANSRTNVSAGRHRKVPWAHFEAPGPNYPAVIDAIRGA